MLFNDFAEEEKNDYLSNKCRLCSQRLFLQRTQGGKLILRQAQLFQHPDSIQFIGPKVIEIYYKKTLNSKDQQSGSEGFWFGSDGYHYCRYSEV